MAEAWKVWFDVWQDLLAAVRHPEHSDQWSDLAASVYFDAAAFHGLDVCPENVPDIFSYAFEAVEALSKLPAPLDFEFECAKAARDWHSGALTRSRFLETIHTLCEEEHRVR